MAETVGISFRHERGARGEWHPVETMGSGVAVLDYDGDGAPDLFFVQGGEVPRVTVWVRSPPTSTTMGTPTC